MTADIREAILQLERDLQAATLTNDVARTDELLADNWLNINATGTLTTKTETLAIMPKFEFVSITNEDVKVRIYPGVVVVTGRSTRELKLSADQIKTSHVLFTRVWALLDGNWQVVTAQATPINQP